MKIDPQELANNIFGLFMKETENNKNFRDALRNFIVAIENKEDVWLKKHLGGPNGKEQT